MVRESERLLNFLGTETRAKYGIVGSAVNETDRIRPPRGEAVSWCNAEP